MPVPDQDHDLELMSGIPAEVAAQINELFAANYRAAERDNQITNFEEYEAFSPTPGFDSLQPENVLFPISTNEHQPLANGLQIYTCALCKQTKVSMWFRGLVFDEYIYCEPCHYKEAGTLTIQAAMARVSLPSR